MLFTSCISDFCPGLNNKRQSLRVTSARPRRSAAVISYGCNTSNINIPRATAKINSANS
jgi:hypothetical protein